MTAAQAQTASADDFDWSAPVSAVKEDKFELKWSDDEEEAPEVDVDDERALLGDEKGKILVEIGFFFWQISSNLGKPI